MNTAMSFLAGMGSGYLDQQDKNKRDARQAKKDAQDDERYQFDKSERERAVKDRDSIRAAAEPVQVQTEGGLPPTMDNRDVGEAGEAPVAPQSYRVGASSFASRGVADQAATDQTRANITGALARVDPVRADQFAASGVQSEASKLTLSNAKLDAANRQFDQRASEAAATSMDALVDFMNQSRADGEGGAVRVSAVRGADGKVTLARVMPDGTTQASPLPPFADTPQERMRIVAGMAHSVPIQEKLKDYREEAETKRRAAHDVAALGIQQQQADTQEQWRKDQAESLRLQRVNEGKRIDALTARQSAPGAPLQVTLKDKRDFESDLSGYIKDQFPAKEGADPAERAAMVAQANQVRALGSTLFENNAAMGIPLTAGTVSQAMQLASDPKNLVVIQVNGVPHKGVMVNGQAVITSGALQRKQQAAAGPAAVPAAGPGQVAPASPAAMAQRGVQPGASAGPPDSQQGTTLDTARAATSLARQKLLAYGSAQRQRDPAGFAQAQTALIQAQEAEQAARIAYEQTMHSAGPSFRMANP